MFVAVVVGVFGALLLFVGLTGHTDAFMDLFGISKVVNGQGTVGPPQPGEDPKHRRPGDPGYNPKGGK